MGFLNICTFSGELYALIRRARRVKIVIAGRYEHGCGYTPERRRKRLGRFGIGAVGIKKVACQKHDINALLLGKPRNAMQQAALLVSALRGLAAPSPSKGESRCRSAACSIFSSLMESYPLCTQAFAGFGVDGEHAALELCRAFGRIVSARRIAEEFADRLLRLDADNGIYSARHAKVCYISCAVGQHAGVGGLHMRVRSPNGARLSVEQEAHCTLFARALGVEIDKDYLLAYLLHVSVGNNEGVIRVRIEREMPHKVHDAHVAEARFINVYAAAGALRRAVCRAQDLAPLVRKIRTQLGARPCVVAEGYDIRTGVQYGVRLARSYADNVCVFAVYDDKSSSSSLRRRRKFLVR